ncbi:hypothetical protein, partial [Pseudomonas viridiflava]|uniref:hypothetical protein n=1 Tax=Pseudomonas viridiflava TaxID=33069 RepID=UPI00197E7017
YGSYSMGNQLFEPTVANNHLSPPDDVMRLYTSKSGANYRNHPKPMIHKAMATKGSGRKMTFTRQPLQITSNAATRCRQWVVWH